MQIFVIREIIYKFNRNLKVYLRLYIIEQQPGISIAKRVMFLDYIKGYAKLGVFFNLRTYLFIPYII